MARFEYYCAASLDGFIADDDDGIGWLMGYQGTYEGGEGAGPMEPGGAYERFYEGVGALAMGSATYEFILGHGSAWPYRGKHSWVLSSRELPLAEGAGDDLSVVSAPVAELAPAMAEAAGERSVWIVGGGNVASQFAAAGFLDALILTVVPVVLGSGKPLFDDPLPGPPLQLTGTRAFGNGMAELSYAVEGDPTG